MRVPWTCGFGLALWLVALSGVARAQAPVVERAALVAALRAEQGYERRATTNQSRLQTRVLLRLAAARQATFAIDHEDWFRAYLEALGSSEAEAPLTVPPPIEAPPGPSLSGTPSLCHWAVTLR